MKKNEHVSKIMSSTLTTINLETSLSQTRKMFAELGVHHLPVVEGNKLIGMLSYSDFLRIDAGAIYQQDEKQADAILDNMSSVKEAMTSNLTTIAPDTTIREATAILTEGSFHSLPVVDAEKNIKGIVTSTDLLKFFLEHY